MQLTVIRGAEIYDKRCKQKLRHGCEFAHTFAKGFSFPRISSAMIMPARVPPVIPVIHPSQAFEPVSARWLFACHALSKLYIRKHFVLIRVCIETCVAKYVCVHQIAGKHLGLNRRWRCNMWHRLFACHSVGLCRSGAACRLAQTPAHHRYEAPLSWMALAPCRVLATNDCSKVNRLYPEGMVRTWPLHLKTSSPAFVQRERAHSSSFLYLSCRHITALQIFLSNIQCLSL